MLSTGAKKHTLFCVDALCLWRSNRHEDQQLQQIPPTTATNDNIYENGEIKKSDLVYVTFDPVAGENPDNGKSRRYRKSRTATILSTRKYNPVAYRRRLTLYMLICDDCPRNRTLFILGEW